MATAAPPRILAISLGRRGGVAEYGRLMTAALAGVCEVAAIHAAEADAAEAWGRFDGPMLAVRTLGRGPLRTSSVPSPRELARIRAFARAFAPDAVYYPGRHPWKPLLDTVLPRDVPAVMTVHDPVLHHGDDSALSRYFQWASRRRVAGFVLLNAAQREAYIATHRIDPARVVVIPHGVFDEYGHHDQSRDLAGLLDPPAEWEGRYLLCLGRVRPYKGIGTLLAAYAALPADTAGPLVIAGDGAFSAEERLRLEALARVSRPVRVINRWLDDAEMVALVRHARFVVLPHLATASQSGVVPLASALGVPAIVADAGGLPEQVVDGRTGLLYRSGDERMLSAVLEEAYAMTEDRHALMAAACSEHAGEQWGWDRLARELAEFVRTLGPARPDGR